MVERDLMTESSKTAARRALVGTITVDGNPGSPPAVNGIDYVEVTNVIDAVPSNDWSELTVRFVHPLVGEGIPPSTPSPLLLTHVSLRGGDRVVDPEILSMTVAGNTMTLRVRPIGDHSIYTLAFDGSPAWLDPQLASVSFSFLVECRTRFDCGGQQSVAPATPPSPHLDYLARDYQSLRQMMLDRLSVTVPDWTERNPADLGVAVVELLAHLGDRLAYGQDVVATEAYLDRARFRTSVARHLRLIDYHLHEGHNARAWIALEVAAPIVVGPRARFWTAVQGHPAVTVSMDLFLDAVREGAEFFESMDTSRHVPQHNRIEFHTWLGTVDVLPKGSTSATIRDPYRSLELRAGSVVLIEETAALSDSTTATDTAQRQVVRLTSVEPLVDPLDQRAGSGMMRRVSVRSSARNSTRLIESETAGREA